MLSVLIPVFNYDVNNLISVIHDQLTAAGLPYEILVLDDYSDQQYINSNKGINNLNNTEFILSNKNNGRLLTRMLLSERAKFDWLLFLDADTIPKSANFIQSYINAIDDDTEAVFGGFDYYKTPPDRKSLLRWRYGIKHEVSPAARRNRKPYKLIISANFLIRKSVWKNLNMQLSISQYGYDSYFGSKLKSEMVKVRHIDNEVYHLGIEQNSKYLEKKEQAAESLLFFYENGLLKEHQHSMLSLFIMLKKFQLHHVLSISYSLFRQMMRSNLTGENPSISLLQLYRISYLCYLYKNRPVNFPSN